MLLAKLGDTCTAAGTGRPRANKPLSQSVSLAASIQAKDAAFACSSLHAAWLPRLLHPTVSSPCRSSACSWPRRSGLGIVQHIVVSSATPKSRMRHANGAPASSTKTLGSAASQARIGAKSGGFGRQICSGSTDAARLLFPPQLRQIQAVRRGPRSSPLAVQPVWLSRASCLPGRAGHQQRAGGEKERRPHPGCCRG